MKSGIREDEILKELERLVEANAHRKDDEGHTLSEWQDILGVPRGRLSKLFGYGLSNGSIHRGTCYRETISGHIKPIVVFEFADKPKKGKR